MHIHHLHMLIQHARLLAGNMRLPGAMLLMLLFGLPGLDGAGTARDLLEVKGARPAAVGHSSCLTAGELAASDSALTPLFRRADRAYPASPAVLIGAAQRSTFNRLEPGIVMVPRMSRIPKPKSVYRVVARAPGVTHLPSCPDAQTASSGGFLI